MVFFVKKKSGRNDKVTVLPRWLLGGVPLYSKLLAGYEELAMGFEPIKSGEIFVTVKGKTNTTV